MKRGDLTPKQRAALGTAHSLRDMFGHVHGSTIQALWRKDLVRVAPVGGTIEAHLTNEGRDLRDALRARVNELLAAHGFTDARISGTTLYNNPDHGGTCSLAAAMRQTGVTW